MQEPICSDETCRTNKDLLDINGESGRYRDFVEIWRDIKGWLNEKCLLYTFRSRLLEKLYSLCQGNMLIHDYMIKFGDLTLHYEVREDCLQAILRFCSRLRSDI